MSPERHRRRAPLRWAWHLSGASVLCAVAMLGALPAVSYAQPPALGAGPASTASVCAGEPVTSTSQAAVSPCSPVDLATPVDFADGYATEGAVVVSGDARFEVLGSGLVRMEYSPTGTFEDDLTVNVLDRHFAVPAYTTSESDGWLTIQTSAVTLSYLTGSGPFTPSNTKFTYSEAGKTESAVPDWQNECPYGQACQSGAAVLAGGATLAASQLGHQSTAGFITTLGQASGASATWTVLGAPGGDATLAVRYANYKGALGGPASRTIEVTLNGSSLKTLTLPATSSWHDWATVTTTVDLAAGTNTVGLLCAGNDSCTVNVDTVSLSAVGSSPPSVASLGPLGGWARTLASALGYTCPAGTAQADECQAVQPPLAAGLLDTSGWYLLDDTPSAQWAPDGWIEPRPAGGDVEDGYLFVYGTGYAGALQAFAQLTGPATLPPEGIFGVWYSDYYPYTQSYYEGTLIPTFQANGVPLDTLSVDTDWKSPNQWDGWEWDPSLFPDPASFLQWAQSEGITTLLNIHPSIATDDPALPEALTIAGGDLTSTTCNIGPCDVWDWGNVAQAESYFSLHQPLTADGVPAFWLDWGSDASGVSTPGVTPDDWVNHLYAQEMVNSGQRGFVLSRMGGSYQAPYVVYPAGPWSAHTSTVHFTDDSWGTWDTLAFEAQLSPDEATIGEPYVSDDIGSYKGPPPGGPTDPADLYTRWVQLGTFQPVLRLHSDAGDRLPWQYAQPADSIATSFLQLREALVPYTYTLAATASFTGMPITQPLYLDYPTTTAAYDYPGEYLYGPDMLVVPVAQPGSVVTQQVWFPPGDWVDYFTAATFQGPGLQSVQMPLNRMPVFVKAGGIIPLQPAMEHVGAAPVDPLTLQVFPGAAGSFSLYQDAGSGLGYQQGQYDWVPMSTQTTAAAGSTPAQTSLTIGPPQGSYPGEPTSQSYEVEMEDLSRPTTVLLDGQALPPVAPGGEDGWWYDAVNQVVDVAVPESPVATTTVVTEVGGSPQPRQEPASVELALDPSTPLSLSPGASTTVTATLTDDGPGAITNVSGALSAPAGWQISPSSVSGLSLADGATVHASVTVTAPSGTGAQSAALVATVNYTSASNGTPGTATTSQQAAPSPPP